MDGLDIVVHDLEHAGSSSDASPKAAIIVGAGRQGCKKPSIPGSGPPSPNVPR